MPYTYPTVKPIVKRRVSLAVIYTGKRTVAVVK